MAMFMHPPDAFGNIHAPDAFSNPNFQSVPLKPQNMPSSRAVIVRYFTTITPKEEGSLIHWRDCPEMFTGIDLRNALTSKGVPLSDHLPQAYNDRFKGYENLDQDAMYRFGPGQSTIQLDVRLTPLAGPLGVASEPAPETKKEKGLALANGGPIALYAFCFTTLLLMCVETGIVESETTMNVMAYAMFHGGFVQLLIGFYELFRNNLFGATAFSSYGAFWMGWGLYHILAEAEVLDPTPHPDGKSGYLAIWGIFTFMMFIQTLFINRALQAIFFLLSLCFFLLSGGVYEPDLTKAGGWVGIVLAVVVFYTATAELYNDLGSMSLPLFPVAQHNNDYGNSKAGRGKPLLQASDPAGVVSLRARQPKLEGSTQGTAATLVQISSTPPQTGIA
mmetsp:Transcript_49606/g.116986  ORF Transcript_49606/g.116986 Transcript_49606/m.116986 type:complete len:390 (+) Transcript_49606:46-1215(+)